MTSTTVKAVVIHYEPNNVLIRHQCAICGGATEKQDPLAEFTIEGKDFAACDQCATAPPELIRLRLANQASTFEGEAAMLRRFATADWTPATETDRLRCSGCGQVRVLDDDEEPWGPSLRCPNKQCPERDR